LSLALASGDFTSFKTIFLDSDWIVTPDLRPHVKSLFPALGAIKNGTGVRDKSAFQIKATPCGFPRLFHTLESLPLQFPLLRRRRSIMGQEAVALK
jgi:hypothetical protein